MLAILLALLLVGLVFGFGFAVHWLFIAAVVLLVLWVLGFFFRGGGTGRWYRW